MTTQTRLGGASGSIQPSATISLTAGISLFARLDNLAATATSFSAPAQRSQRNNGRLSACKPDRRDQQ